MINCPYCSEEDCVPDKVYANVENYGDRIFNVPCSKCGKMIKVVAIRQVTISFISPAAKGAESDFS